MGRKKIIYLQLYIKDYTGDERLRWCSPAAWGVYSYLLCLLSTAEIRGSLQLSKLEKHPTWKNSLTNKCLNATTERGRLVPFSIMLCHQMPWKQTQILEALCELAHFRVIVVQGDTLIQPRMYRESGHHLDPEVDKYLNENENHNENGFHTETTETTEIVNNDNENDNDNDAASRNNDITISRNNENEKGGNNETSSPQAKVQPSSPKKKKTPAVPFDDFWDLYDKKRDRATSERLWLNLSKRDQEAAMAYIPAYKQAQPEKQFRKDPTTFLRHRSWEDELIQDRKPSPQSKPNKRINPTLLTAPDKGEEW